MSGKYSPEKYSPRGRGSLTVEELEKAFLVRDTKISVLFALGTYVRRMETSTEAAALVLLAASDALEKKPDAFWLSRRTVKEWHQLFLRYFDHADA